jgi:hypothetical protein
LRISVSSSLVEPSSGALASVRLLQSELRLSRQRDLVFRICKQICNVILI